MTAHIYATEMLMRLGRSLNENLSLIIFVIVILCNHYNFRIKL